MIRLELLNITKRYPGCVANRNINLRVRQGEIHALLGENGAGKSTLMKIIYGVVKPDQGQFIWEGAQQTIRDPYQARALGIGMVFQHFSLFESLTVLENISLSLPKGAFGKRAQLRAAIIDTSTRYGLPLNPDRAIYSLSVGERQRVEIVRCLLQKIRLLILDEPTAVLTPGEVANLFNTLRQLRDEGCSILFISHKLNEVRDLCDRASVLRNGAKVAECDPRSTTPAQMAELMVGENITLEQHFHRAGGGAVCLHIDRLNHAAGSLFATPLQDIELEVRAGEIVGIAGVAGNGQEELLALLSGEDTTHANAIVFNGKAIGNLDARQRRALDLAFVPEERLGRGAIPDFSLEQNNLLTGFQHGLSRHGLLQRQRIIDSTREILRRFNVKCSGNSAQAKSLSGGNLQKFILGREISHTPKLLICSHPTWGVDIGAAILIRKELIALRDQGAAILIVSEDIDELYELCDRLCAICQGKLSPLAATEQLPLPHLGQWMTGDFAPLPTHRVPTALVAAASPTLSPTTGSLQ